MRVLLPAGPALPGSLVALDDDEAHHIRVRRAEAGETVELRNGAGLSGLGALEMDRGRWAVRITRVELAEPPAALILAVGAGDKERFGWLVEKAAELGVTELVPLETERTASVATRIRAQHREKLETRAREAIKQSGALWAPAVRAPVPLESFLTAPAPGQRWLADPAGAPPSASAAGPVTVLVGPEGGFTAAEHAAAIGAGWQPVRLAPHVLRFETAALAAAVSVIAARERTAP